MRDTTIQYAAYKRKQSEINVGWLASMNDADISSRYWCGVLYASMAFYSIPNGATYCSINVAPDDAHVYAGFLADCGLYVSSIVLRDGHRNAFRFTHKGWNEYFMGSLGYASLVKERSLEPIEQTDSLINTLREEWSNNEDFLRGYCDACSTFRRDSKATKFEIIGPDTVIKPVHTSAVLSGIEHKVIPSGHARGKGRLIFYDDHMRVLLNRLGYASQGKYPYMPTTQRLLDVLKDMNIGTAFSIS